MAKWKLSACVSHHTISLANRGFSVEPGFFAKMISTRVCCNYFDAIFNLEMDTTSIFSVSAVYAS